MNLVKGLKAVASVRRLRILELLRRNKVGKTGERGLSATELRMQLGLSQPALNEQMQVLLDVGLVESRHVGRWVIYTRDEERIRQLRQTITDQLLPPVAP